MTYPMMGGYKVVSSVQTEECSLRLLRLGEGETVESHYHKLTTQIYLALEGVVEVRVGSTARPLRPYEMLRVPPGTPHGLRSPGPALILSLSIPPLQVEDQHPVG